MPVESFNHRKPANGAREGVVPVSQAWGTRVHGTDRVGSAGANVQPAGLFSTAPYVDEHGSHPSPLVGGGAPTVRHDVEYLCSAKRIDGSPCTAKLRNGTLCGPHRREANKREYPEQEMEQPHGRPVTA